MPILDLDVPTAEVSALPEGAESWRRRPGPPPRREPRRAEPAEGNATLSVSALSQGSPMISASGEFRLAPRMGLTLTGALGGDAYPAWDAGVGVDGYVAGDFSRGLSLGAVVGASDLGLDPIIGSAPSITPRVGVKYTFPVPITLEAYAGVTIQPADVALVVAPSLRIGAGFTF